MNANLFIVLIFGDCQDVFNDTYQTRYDAHTNITSVELTAYDLYDAMDKVSDIILKHLRVYYTFKGGVVLVTDNEFKTVLTYETWYKYKKGK